MTPLERGVYVLLGACFPNEEPTVEQLRAARAALTPEEHADLQQAKARAAYWLERRGPEAARKLAFWMKRFFALYGAGFARAGTPLPIVALHDFS